MGTRTTRTSRIKGCAIHDQEINLRNPRNPRLKNAAQRSLQTPRSSALSRVVRVPIHR